MWKKILLFVSIIVLACPVLICAAESPNLAILPFYVFSQEPLEHLQFGLQEILIKKLKHENIRIIDSDTINHIFKKIDKPFNLTNIRNLVSKLGANIIVTTALTKIGDRISFDSKIINMINMQEPIQLVFIEDTINAGDFTFAIDQLSHEIKSKILRYEQVVDIIIQGNYRIETEAIKSIIKTKVAGSYSPTRLNEDLRTIWDMGFFDDVHIETSDSSQGKIIVILVTEKPIIREIKFFGNKIIDDNDLRDQMGIKLFSVFRPELLLEVNSKIIKMYRDKGYYDTKVDINTEHLESNDKRLIVKIEEGTKIFIKRIEFIGNINIKTSDLKEQMNTKETGWLSWLTEDNILERGKLNQDIEKLIDYYYNQGYVIARIAEKEIRRYDEGLEVIINIQEGHRFKVGNVNISGDIIKTQEELIGVLKTKPGNWFNRDILRDDINNLTILYADQGFAYVEVHPQIDQDNEKYLVNLGLNIKKGEKIYFEQIIISGNTNTRDKVIRRELSVAEGNLFSGTAIREANSRLIRSNFFDDVHVTTTKSNVSDRINLKIDVKEKRTGQLSLGAGYSTADHFVLIGRIGENNLFGRGQQLELRGQLGGTSNRYSISLTEPWFLDKPISIGIDLYDWDREYYSYSKEAIGGRLRFGFPIPIRYTKLYTYYTYEVANVYDIQSNAAAIIRDQEGEHTTSSIRIILRRDSRDHFFNPSRGNDNSISIEYAGDPIGGSNAFIKVLGDSGWYLPLWLQHIFVLHSRIGWLTGHAGGNLPIYEKFFLGGINTLRGFDYQSVGPRDTITNDRIGGERILLANIEYRFPMLVKAGLMGVIFYDIGNSWSEVDGYNVDILRSSIGAGIRWLSPVGPLRLEYGYVLNPRFDESESNWEFTIGSIF